MYSQSVRDIDSMLDNTIYYQLNNFNYTKNIELPDSTKDKIIKVLNGYLPIKDVEEVSALSRNSDRFINRMAADICKQDSICFARVKDSITYSIIQEGLASKRTYPFPASFILAIGSWNIQNAMPILLDNINNPLFPKEEVLLALAKLGNDSIRRDIKKQYTLNYVINNTEFKINSREYIYRNANMERVVSSFYNAGQYLSDRDILLNMVDLLDVEGKGIFLEELVNIELLTTMWLNLCFIENEQWQKWDEIVGGYFDNLSEPLSTNKTEDVTSKTYKELIKNQLKTWILENAFK
jgi:hypothetical protein